ncbi:GNAT family N-acetyltransferase [Anaerobacillus sp. CMMVII]|uniref:GNAT family N-acetyltransferase n=1 Tax=Anaerobacillus sp. CMMVII TaxID=2755588 RepID=UPI0021B734AC|nr:GNAT family N-acetyltransferase [Anaerobacillus sp. CMMVII]MCT8138036.1 GNAT family N-acetyltransferase [Anaerobacillus sp. CMMVII]
MRKKIHFRKATIKDLEKIVHMLSDDKLGSMRENYELPLQSSYTDAFQAIDSDPNIELIVACDGETIVGVLQLTFTPHLTYQGGWRATIEGVRTVLSEQGKGIGSKLTRRAIARAKERNCHVVQLTTDKTRKEALRFYEKLGFRATHQGLKLHL